MRISDWSSDVCSSDLALAKIHPRFRTPALAIITVGVLSLLLALSGSFVQLALLSVVARLCTYIGTSVSVLVLRRRYGDREQELQDRKSVIVGRRVAVRLVLGEYRISHKQKNIKQLQYQ